MRLPTSLFICAALAAASPATTQDQQRSQGNDLLATAAGGGFETLLTAVRAAGLEEVLRSEGPFTVLAPTDAAFAALPESLLTELLRPEARDRLGRILRYHVVSGRVSGAEALAAGSVSTLAGDRLTVELDRGQLTIGGVKVVSNDIETSNGLIHAIDAVLVPPDAVASSLTPISSIELIELAIERGAPLFNAGQRAACAAIYEVTGWSLLSHSEPPLTSEARSLLEAGLRSGADSTPSDRAWQLRRALDATYAFLRGAHRSEPGAAATAFVIEGFDEARSAESWRPVNDTVMGGRSRSALAVNREGTAVFSGEVSLENNGGFSSVRRSVDAGSLQGFDGVELRVRGDGKTYRLNVSGRREISGDLYRAEFQTRDGEWTEVRLPFSAMERSVRGFQPPDSPPIEPTQIRSIGVSIGDKQAGPFRLEIDSIRAYRNDER